MPSVHNAVDAIVFSHAQLVRKQIANRSCIMASEGARILLEEWGIPATVHRADVFGFNHNYFKARKGKQQDARHPQGYSLRLTHTLTQVGRDGYDGHAVVEVDGSIYDLTAGQFDRPEHGIRMGEPMRWPLGDFKQLPRILRRLIPNPGQGVALLELELPDGQELIDTDPDNFLTLDSLAPGLIKTWRANPTRPYDRGRWLLALRPDLDDSGYASPWWWGRLDLFLDQAWRVGARAYLRMLEQGIPLEEVNRRVHLEPDTD